MSGRNIWLITGGAGYIGAHIADSFLAQGKEVVIFDSLHNGLEARIDYLNEKYKRSIPLVVADIRDAEEFTKVLRDFKPHGVIHTAALKSVSESMEKPHEYFEVNSAATKQILEIMSLNSVSNFIFSSTAAIYGSPIHLNPIKEDDIKKPISPYGASKLAAESEVNSYLSMPGNHGTSLRFFNVVGAGSSALMDNSRDNLIPIVVSKLLKGLPPKIYGADYPTPDGTCVRDYVDVRDIARAHLLAATSKNPLPRAMNVGRGQGYSVREVIKLVSHFLGKDNISPFEGKRRSGDSALLCADAELIQNHLGFLARFSLEESLENMLR
jgi:UDP-glucose 4-epimerase